MQKSHHRFRRDCLLMLFGWVMFLEMKLLFGVTLMGDGGCDNQDRSDNDCNYHFLGHSSRFLISSRFALQQTNGPLFCWHSLLYIRFKKRHFWALHSLTFITRGHRHFDILKQLLMVVIGQGAGQGCNPEVFPFQVMQSRINCSGQLVILQGLFLVLASISGGSFPVRHDMQEDFPFAIDAKVLLPEAEGVIG